MPVLGCPFLGLHAHIVLHHWSHHGSPRKSTKPSFVKEVAALLEWDSSVGDWCLTGTRLKNINGTVQNLQRKRYRNKLISVTFTVMVWPAPWQLKAHWLLEIREPKMVRLELRTAENPESWVLPHRADRHVHWDSLPSFSQLWPELDFHGKISENRIIT